MARRIGARALRESHPGDLNEALAQGPSSRPIVVPMPCFRCSATCPTLCQTIFAR
jgi:hypothetical protein